MLVKDRIILERKKQDISCADLAQAVGLHKGTINRYENGNIKRIPTEMLHRIAEALHISFDDLISDDPSYVDLLDHPTPRKSSKKRTSDEQEMIEWYRSLSPDAKSFFKQLWHIKPTL
jgi:transcriptional regulator with XRE-family HTH domain